MIEQVVLYSNGSQECERIKMLIQSIGEEYHEYHLGIDFSDRQFRQEFGSEAEYPQVAIGLNHIGSLKETLQYLNSRGVV